MSESDVAQIARGLTERPRLALACDRWPGGLTWMEVVQAARKPNDRRAVSFRVALQPLLTRNLAIKVRESRYCADTADWTQALYALTSLGIAVRAHLETAHV